MRTCWVLVLALVLATVGFTGCLGDEGPESPANATQPDQGPVTGSNDTVKIGDESGVRDANLSPLRYAPETPVDETIWANGTFGPTDACPLNTCATDNTRTVTVAETLPTGTPFRVQADLTWETGPGVNSPTTIDLSFDAEDWSVYGYAYTVEIGHQTLNVTGLLQEGPAYLELHYDTPTVNAEPSLDYEVRTQVQTLNTTIPNGAPVAVQASPGDRFQLTTPSGSIEDGAGNPSLNAYGPNDDALTRVKNNTLPLNLTLEGNTSGEYVFYPTQGHQDLEAWSTQPRTMRALPTQTTFGEAHPVQGESPVAWSIDTEQHMLALGLYHTPGDDPQASSEPGHATVTGPAGVLMEGSTGCGPCANTGMGGATFTAYEDGLFSDWGNPALQPGTYDFTYEPSQEQGSEVFHIRYDYVR